MIFAECFLAIIFIFWGSARPGGEVGLTSKEGGSVHGRGVWYKLISKEGGSVHGREVWYKLISKEWNPPAGLPSFVSTPRHSRGESALSLTVVPSA